MKSLPTLYHKAKGGDLRQWTVWTEGPDIVTEYGQVGGKLQTSRKTAEGKNIGRSNETSPIEQALLEAKSLHTFKLERKYSETQEKAQEPLNLPMLAHKYEGTKKSKFKFPADVQPKLDGCRMLVQKINGDMVLTSRQGKEYIVPHVADSLWMWLPEDTILDGELYIHGESCQRITSLIKSADPKSKSYKKESEDLVYHIYDVPIMFGQEALTWGKRREFLSELRGSKCVKIVSYREVNSDKDVWDAHGAYIQEGYEGAILRARNGIYSWGYRSSDLLKVKSFQDGEFEVIGARDGDGKMKGCVVWICKNDLTDATFECTMNVPMSEQARMYREQKQYIGKMLTIRYFDRTDEQKPRFLKGIVFRDEKDL